MMCALHLPPYARIATQPAQQQLTDFDVTGRFQRPTGDTYNFTIHGAHGSYSTAYELAHVCCSCARRKSL